jgi:hypothetical protein
MERKSSSYDSSEKVKDAMDQEGMLFGHMSVPREFHFSFSSIKLKDNGIHVVSNENEMENRNQDQDKQFEDLESISVSIKCNESDLRLHQQNELRSEFSLSSLDSIEFFDGIDSILVAKQRATRKFQAQSKGISHENCHKECYETTQSPNREIQTEK